MGYGVMAYRVDIELVANKFGCRDQRLKHQYASDFADRIRRLDDDFEPEHGWPSCQSIIDDFIDGKLPADPKTNTAKHWFVIECLVAKVGKMLPNDAWYPSAIDPLFQIRELQMFFVDKTKKLALEGADDFPTVFTVLHENLKKALTAVQASALETEQKTQFEAWVTDIHERLKTKKHDLVLFYY
jgi:hypothetical protein